MESIIGLFKTECITTTVFHDGPYKTIADIEYATAGWIDWYNHRRLHGDLPLGLGHAESRTCVGESEMISDHGPQELFR